MPRYAQPHLMKKYWIRCFPFLVNCANTKNQQGQLTPSRYISDQGILEYDCLRAYPAATPEKPFLQTMGLSRKIDIDTTFCLRAFQVTRNANICVEKLKNPTIGPFLVIFARRGLCMKFLALSHTTPLEPLISSQISDKTKFQENFWIDGRTEERMKGWKNREMKG